MARMRVSPRVRVGLRSPMAWPSKKGVRSRTRKTQESKGKHTLTPFQTYLSACCLGEEMVEERHDLSALLEGCAQAVGVNVGRSLPLFVADGIVEHVFICSGRELWTVQKQ